MNILKIFPFVKLEMFNKEPSFIVKTNLLEKVIFLFKNHFKCQFKILTCISGIDYPNNSYRFQIVYELLSIRFNSRVSIKCFANELVPVTSIENIFLGASWWESEVWDMFGIFFNSNTNLVRILTDYGFEGYPLRKDFPLSGFIELKYDEGKKIGQQVEAKRNKAVAKLKEKEQEYVDAAKEFKAKAATMSEDARIKAQKKLTKMERTYKADLQEIEEELKIAMHQAQEKLVREHNDAVYEYARANNVDIVFGPGGVVYASEKAKCTGDVVKNMNKNYSQKLARAKGKKAATTVASKTVKKPLVKA